MDRKVTANKHIMNIGALVGAIAIQSCQSTMIIGGQSDGLQIGFVVILEAAEDLQAVEAVEQVNTYIADNSTEWQDMEEDSTEYFSQTWRTISFTRFLLYVQLRNGLHCRLQRSLLYLFRNNHLSLDMFSI